MEIGVYIGVWFDIILGGIFWLWALSNVIKHKRVDLGAITFFTVLIAGIVGMVAAYGPDNVVTEDYFTGFIRYQLFAHCFVALNFFLGMLLPEKKIEDKKMNLTQWRIFCGSFSLLWLGTGIYFFISGQDSDVQ